MTDEKNAPPHNGPWSPGSEGPLSGIRVIEVGQAVAAPLCARHLADLGADVIKIESPIGGDLARNYDSVAKGTSAYFTWANYGKRSVALDLKSEDGRAAIAQLLATADIFVHNLGPGAMDRLGFDPKSVQQINSRLVNCAITGYGADGPMRDRKAFDLLIQGESGLMSVTGTEDQVAKVGISVVDMCTAVYALSAIQAALLQRTRTDEGTYLDISMLECLSEWMMAPTYHQLYGETQPRREGARHNMMVPYGVYSTGSRTSVNFAIQTDVHWRLFCDRVVRRPGLAQDPRFESNERRVANRVDLEQLIEAIFKEAGHQQVLQRLVDAGIPSGEVNDLKGLSEHPQLEARNRWFDIETAGGLVRAIRAPFNLPGLNTTQKSVPSLGQHTHDVLNALETYVGI